MGRWLYLWMGIIFSPLIAAETVHIGAAANMRFVLPDIIAAFEAQHDARIAVTYAASGTLSNQIRHGAPYQIFLSADEESISPLQTRDLVQGKPFRFADAQLALFARQDSKVTLDPQLNGLRHFLQTDSQQKIAIANPQHAPYGRAAKQYLQQFGLWPQVQAQLVQAENASQLTQFSLSGNVALGFIPLSHALHPSIQQQGRYLTLPVVLTQRGVLTQQATAEAGEFVTFLTSDVAKSYFLKHGFIVPGAL